MTTLSERRASAAAGSAPSGTRWLPVLVGAAVVLSVLVRLHAASAMWLDEVLSVNIARLPLHSLPEALRHDGSPPLYYLLLHGWMAVFGTGTTAVRALSSVFALAALPLMWLLARRLRGSETAWVAVLLLGTSPFVVRYATETRMYSMVLALVLAGGVALVAALERPTPLRLLGLAVASGLLLLTHYWSIYLLTVVGLLLIRLALRGARVAAARRCLAAIVAGGLLFVPWLPSFLYQLRHTGTPWAKPPKVSGFLGSIGSWAGGITTASGGLLTLLLLALLLLALVGHRQDHGVLIGRPVDRTAAALVAVGLGTLALGLLLAAFTSAGYAVRYSSAAVGPFLLAAALGAEALPRRASRVVVALTVVAGVCGSLNAPFSHNRTEAALIAQALRPRLGPGDVVVYCPDQTGPAVSRLLPAGTDQVVYPTMGRPERVDWVDYAQRNASASPAAFAERLLARGRGTIWMVAAGEHLTFGHQCEDLDRLLAQRRGGRELVVPVHKRYAEWEQLTRYPAG